MDVSPVSSPNHSPQDGDSPLLRVVLPAIVLLAAGLPFLDVLNYYFTKTDTVAIIYSSRLYSLQDLARILTSPVKSLTAREIYYRPVTSLSFGLNHLVGGLDPFGYHLTNLALHGLVGGLLFLFVYRLNDRDLPTAFLSGMIYTLHPVLIEVVPMMPHRQVTLTTVFLLGGLCAFWSYEFGEGGGGTFVLSLGCFLLAMGSKEMGVIFLPLVLLILVLFKERGDRSWTRWGLDLLGRTIPYGLVVGLYLLLWGLVTQGRFFLGGGTRITRPLVRGSIGRTLLFVGYKGFTNATFYFSVLLAPFKPLYAGLRHVSEAVSSTVHWYLWGGTGAWMPALFLSLATAGLLVRVLRGIRSGSRDHARGLTLPRTVRIGFLIGLLTLVALPLYDGVVRSVIRKAHHGTSFTWLAVLMESKAKLSPDHYQARALSLLRTAGITLAAAGGLLLLMTARDLRKRCVRTLRTMLRRLSRSRWRPGWFYLGWILVPGFVFALARIWGRDNVYYSVPAFSALLAMLLVHSARRAAASLRRLDVLERHSGKNPTGRVGRALGWGFTVILAGWMVVLVGLRSPWVNREFEKVYGPVQMSHKRYMKALKPALTTLPPGADVRLLDVPIWFHPIFDRSPLPHSGDESLIIRYDLLIKMIGHESLTLVEGTGRFFRSADPDPEISVEVRKRPDGVYDLVARVGNLSDSPFETPRVDFTADDRSRVDSDPPPR